jgi:hypothetical protein
LFALGNLFVLDRNIGLLSKAHARHQSVFLIDALVAAPWSPRALVDMVSMFKIARESLLEALGLASHDVNGAWLQMLSTESLKSIMRDFNTNYELPAEQGGIVPHAEKYRIDKSQIQSDLFNDPARFRNATATEQKSWTRHEWYRWAILRIVDESGLPLFQKEEHDMRDKISTGVTVFEAMRMHWVIKPLTI